MNELNKMLERKDQQIEDVRGLAEGGEGVKKEL